jgi:hypothetical protein
VRVTLVAVGVLVVAAVAGAEPQPTDPRLSATLVGQLEPGQEGWLAVRWNGPPGELLDAWVDLDGDGELGGDELVVDGRPLAVGIEVVNLGLERRGAVVAEPRVWVRARGGGPERTGEITATVSCAGERGACAWQPGYAVFGLDAPARAMVVHDDGSGPALYVGGEFTTAGGEVVNHIARWNGAGWSDLSGAVGIGLDNSVLSFAVYDDGTGPALYAGGSFVTAGGITVNRIARWDGVTWSALSGPSGAGVGGGSVKALAVYDDGNGPALYAGGDFSTAGGGTAYRLARWNGSAWSAVSGLSGASYIAVIALAVYEDGNGAGLYVGGQFETVGGLTVNNIARWDGTSWSSLSGPSQTGMHGGVSALTVYDDGTGAKLYAGGWFDTAGGVHANAVAQWDGVSWSALIGPAGNGVDLYVDTLGVHDDGSGFALYAGGHFTTAGGVTVNRIARWDGVAWSALSGPSGTGMGTGGYYDQVLSLGTFDDGTGPALYAGGAFTTAGGVPANRIARWDGSAWSALPDSSLAAGLPGDVRALAVYDDGTGPALYAGGGFATTAAGLSNHIARWDGSAWSVLSGPLATGVDGAVEALAVYDDGLGPALYAGGTFVTAGGVEVNNVARWDGSTWAALSGPSGTGTSSGIVRALTVYDDGSGPSLYAAGWFENAGGITVNNVARWDGNGWSALSGPSATGLGAALGAFALGVYDDGLGSDLYVVGDFGSAGGLPVSNVARWNGSVWSALPGFDNTARALAVVDDGAGPALYAGGTFTTAGGVTVNRIARWNGSGWSALSGPAGVGLDGAVASLSVFGEGGFRPALYAGGWLTVAGGVTVNHVARWDGGSWTALSGPEGTGTNGNVLAFAGFDDGSGSTLYVGGVFIAAGGLPSSHIAAWRCPTDVFADGFEDRGTAAWSLTVP